MAARDAVEGLPEKLEAAREAAGLDQTAAAKKSGVSNVNISRFESGKQTPSIATLYKLAAAYGANVCDLLPGGVMPVTEPEEKEEGKPLKGKRVK